MVRKAKLTYKKFFSDAQEEEIIRLRKERNEMLMPKPAEEGKMHAHRPSWV